MSEPDDFERDELGLLNDDDHAELLKELKAGCSDEEYQRFAIIWRSSMQLGFKCKNCGHCCMVCDPAILGGNDIDNIAKCLKIPRNKVIKKYVKVLPNGQASLKHVAPCKFYDFGKKQCKIYKYRPHVCRYYPFLAGREELAT